MSTGTNFPSTLACREIGVCKSFLVLKLSIHLWLATNPMVCKSFLVLKLSIHLRLCDESDGL